MQKRWKRVLETLRINNWKKFYSLFFVAQAFKLVLERTWVRVRSSTFLGCSSSFSSSLEIWIKFEMFEVRKCQSSGVRSSDFLGSFLFRDFFGQKYLTETREILPFIFPLEVYLVKIVFELATKKHYFLKLFEMSQNHEFFILHRSSKFGLRSSSSTCNF